MRPTSLDTRAKHRTWRKPRSSSDWMTREPMNPVDPVTRIGSSGPMMEPGRPAADVSGDDMNRRPTALPAKGASYCGTRHFEVFAGGRAAAPEADPQACGAIRGAV